MNTLNLVTIELESGFDTGEEIFVKVPEGILTMTVVGIEEYDVDGEDDFGNYYSGTVYSLTSIESVKLNGEASVVYMDEIVNKKLISGTWSITYTEGHHHDNHDRYGGAENY